VQIFISIVIYLVRIVILLFVLTKLLWQVSAYAETFEAKLFFSHSTGPDAAFASIGYSQYYLSL